MKPIKFGGRSLLALSLMLNAFMVAILIGHMLAPAQGPQRPASGPLLEAELAKHVVAMQLEILDATSPMRARIEAAERAFINAGLEETADLAALDKAATAMIAAEMDQLRVVLDARREFLAREDLQTRRLFLKAMQSAIAERTTIERDRRQRLEEQKGED